MGTIVYVFVLFVRLSVQENIGCQLHGDNDSGDGQVTVFLLSCEGELDVFSNFFLDFDGWSRNGFSIAVPACL